jgi:hypothetical protein
MFRLPALGSKATREHTESASTVRECIGEALRECLEDDVHITLR